MNCEEARLHIGADPGAPDSAVAGHLRGCAACSAFQREMSALDGQIRRALEGALPDTRLVEPHTKPRVRPRVPGLMALPRRWALAASVLLALGIGAALWVGRSGSALADEVVEHVRHEPASWTRSEALPASVVDRALSRVGVSLEARAADVVYAQTCPFRGGIAPHLVVRTDTGPFTVLVLAHEPVSEARSFREEGFAGLLVPAGSGSLAVLARDADTSRAELEAVAQRVRAALRWN